MPPVINRGRMINYISGLSGVAAGGQAILNVPVNARYHGMILNCTSAAGVPVAVTTNITSIKLIVNGTPVRDIDPANILKICQAQGYYPLLGELPIWFTEPLGTGQNIIEPDDVLSWDMFGQQTFQIQIGIAAGAGATPGITGVWIFDYLRNTLPDGSLVLQPVAQHQFSFPIVVGKNDITILPFEFPIRRIYLYGGTLGHILDCEIYQDGQKVQEATVAQARQATRPYGFRYINTPDSTYFRNATGPADLAVSALLETPVFFDYNMITDPDGRWWRCLKCAKNFNIRVNSDLAMTLNIVMETLPGAYR